MSAWEIVHVTGSTYYIPAPVNIGLYCREGNAFLIDSGNDKEAGRKIQKLLKEAGLKLHTIVNTHAHADHIGGNAFLQKRSGCRICAPALEAAFITYPELESALLFGGFPHHGLETKLLKAEKSSVTAPFSSKGSVPGTPLDAIALPGHSPAMHGIMTPDNVFFIADSLIDPAIIKKHPVFYLYNIQEQLHTLEILETYASAAFIPSHGDLQSSITSMIRKNREGIKLITGKLQEFIQTEGMIPLDDLVAKTAKEFHVKLNHIQYVLLRSCISSYVSWMASRNTCALSYSDGKLLIEKQL